MSIAYPYIAEGRTIAYVPPEDPFMQEAKRFACANSLDKAQRTGSVVVKDGVVVGRGANGSTYHETHECERVRLKIPTGQGYELCEGCHPRNHSEPKAIADAHAQGHNLLGADLYLWGHWWLCKPCWDAVIAAGIRRVHLLEGSEALFDRTKPGNILGHQCV